MPHSSDKLPKNLPDWLNWIEILHPDEVELGLTRVKNVAQHLALLDYFRSSQVKVITIAGTNGKGSTAAVIERIAHFSGLSVGCFSSPHFIRYNERIRVNNDEASDQLICQAFTEIAQHTKDNPLTYFEYGTLAALQVFKNAGVELVILEVGLGGRLDAVNIIDADIAMITSIGIDHQDWLGDTREQIGAEKAGILRANIPLVCGEVALPDSISERVTKFGAHLYQRELNYGLSLNEESQRYEWFGKDALGTDFRLTDLPTPLVPNESVASALQAILLLDSSLLQRSIIQSSLSSLKLFGRFFKLPNKPVIIDVAHNPDAAKYLSKQLKQNPIKGKRIAVISVIKDKDLAGIIDALADDIDTWFPAQLDLPRAATVAQMSNSFERQGISAYRTMESIESALIAAEKMMTEQDQLLIVGSFFTAAAALNAWGIGSLAELVNSTDDFIAPGTRD